MCRYACKEFVVCVGIIFVIRLYPNIAILYNSRSCFARCKFCKLDTILHKVGSVLDMVPAFVGTLGAMSIAQGLTFLITKAKPIPGLSDGFKFIGGGSIGPIPIPIIVMAVVLIICFTLLYKTKYGRYVYAVGGNLNAAHVSGINTKRIICSVYIISGLLAALAGVITTARVTSGVTSTGDGYETDAIAMVVIGGTSLAGGKGRLWGTVIGILLIQCLTTGLDMLGVSYYVQLIVKGFVVIGAVMLDSLNAD